MGRRCWKVSRLGSSMPRVLSIRMNKSYVPRDLRSGTLLIRDKNRLDVPVGRRARTPNWEANQHENGVEERPRTSRAEICLEAPHHKLGWRYGRSRRGPAAMDVQPPQHLDRCWGCCRKLYDEDAIVLVTRNCL